jgi:sulfite oxidase
MSRDHELSIPGAGKRLELMVHQEDPINMGTPPALVRRSYITPQAHFFVRNHSGIPHVNPHSYRLSVTGLVRTPLNLTLSELRKEFAATTVVATLQCAGHRRNELAAIHPIPGELPWGADALGNALWCGVLLREILLTAGIEAGAQHLTWSIRGYQQVRGRADGILLASRGWTIASRVEQGSGGCRLRVWPPL